MNLERGGGGGHGAPGVDGLEPVDAGVPVEVAGDVRRVERRGATLGLGVLVDPLQGLDEAVEVAVAEQPGAGAAAADDLQVRCDVAGDDRRAAAHRLEQRERQPLERGRLDEGRGRW